MSVLIKDMEKPKTCYAVIDGESEYCPFVNTDDDCVLLLKKGTCEGTWEEQYSKCPLVEVPQPCEDAVNRTDMLETYADLYDIFEDNDQIRKELNKVYDKLNALSSVTPKLSNVDYLMPESELVFYDNDHGFCINTQDALEHIRGYMQ